MIASLSTLTLRSTSAFVMHMGGLMRSTFNSIQSLH
jgi:hypothetical protein